MKIGVLIAVLAFSYPIRYTYRTTDGAIIAELTGVSVARPSPPSGEADIVKNSSQIVGVTTDLTDEGIPTARINAQGDVVQRSNTAINLERQSVRRASAMERLDELLSRYQSLQSLAPTTPTTEYTARLQILQNRIQAAKTAAGLQQ